MDNDFYFTLLQKTSEKGTLIYVNISDEIKNHFLDNNNIPDVIHTSLNRNVDIVLDRFKEANHLVFRNETPEINFATNTDCLDKIKVEAAITPTGVIFLYERKKIDGMLTANKLTRNFIYATVFIGLLTAFIGYKNLELDKKVHQLKLNTLKQELPNKPIQQKKIPTTPKKPTTTLPIEKKTLSFSFNCSVGIYAIVF
jgi:hypothetical protein